MKLEEGSRGVTLNLGGDRNEKVRCREF